MSLLDPFGGEPEKVRFPPWAWAAGTAAIVGLWSITVVMGFLLSV